MVQPTQEQLNGLIQLYQSNKLEEAEAEAQKLLKQFPEDLTCLNILGVILDAKGQTEDAIKIYEKALQTKVNDIVILPMIKEYMMKLFLLENN